MQKLLFTFFFLFASVCGQSDYAVQFNENVLELYYNGMWYNLRDKIDYREGGPLCNALSPNYSLVDYSKIDVPNQVVVDISCSENENLTECSIEIDSSRDKLLNLTCMSSAGLQPGTLRQLDDGRILYLYQPSQINFLVWAHICNDDNANWDQHAADLFCQEIGFENVKSGQFKVDFQDKVDAFGLQNFDCSQATQFSECTFSPIGGNARCSNGEVFTIQCENPQDVTTSFQKTTQKQSVTITTQLLPTNDGNELESKQTVIIPSVVSVVVVNTILLVLAVCIIICCIVHKRKKRMAGKSNTPYDSNEEYNSRSTTNLHPLDTPHKYYNAGDVLTAPQPAGNVQETSLTVDEHHLYYETTGLDGSEDIYSSVIHEYDCVVLDSNDRKYYEIHQTDQQKSDNIYMQPDDQLPCFNHQNDKSFWEPEDTETGIYSQMAGKRYREIDAKFLTQDEILGQGNFEFVHSGIWNSKKGKIPVAIKSLKVENDETNVKLLQKAAIIGQFNHPNVLKLLGVVTLSHPFMMVTELMTGGLKEHLDKIRQSQQTKIHPLGNILVRFTKDICLGMQYLASKKFIHRYLTARSIFVNQKLNCKIGDFRLARMVEDNDYYLSSGGLIPLKCTAPEAILFKKYSEKSDVWSYGVTLYEIWTVGRVDPWDNFSTEEVVKNISESTLLPPPTGCPRFIYELMVRRWNPERELRPSFQEIMQLFNSNENEILRRGNRREENLDLGLDPVLSSALFTDLQDLYK